MEMHPLTTVLLSLRVPAPSTARALLPEGLTSVCGVGFGLGSCVLPVFKEQSQAWILFLLCPVLAVYLDLHPAVSLPACAGNVLPGFGSTQALPGEDSCFFFTFLSPVPEQGEHPGPCGCCLVTSPTVVAPAAI